MTKRKSVKRGKTNIIIHNKNSKKWKSDTNMKPKSSMNNLFSGKSNVLNGNARTMITNIRRSN